MKHQCLRFEELPRPGTLVAIDAEFEQMQQVLIPNDPLWLALS